MAKQLMDIVLPRLARPLYRHLERYQVGAMSEDQFTRKFERLLQKQHDWLAQHGIDASKAAVAIHAAVIVLSMPGLRAEAAESRTPLEVLEHRAVCEAALDVASSYNLEKERAIEAIARLVARYGE
jgi:hypothetical protein